MSTRGSWILFFEYFWIYVEFTYWILLLLYIFHLYVHLSPLISPIKFISILYMSAWCHQWCSCFPEIFLSSYLGYEFILGVLLVKTSTLPSNYVKIRVNTVKLDLLAHKLTKIIWNIVQVILRSSGLFLCRNLECVNININKNNLKATFSSYCSSQHTLSAKKSPRFYWLEEEKLIRMKYKVLSIDSNRWIFLIT